MKKRIINIVILLTIFLSLNYSTSYQQFRHFNINEVRGLTDQKSYIEMSKGNFDVSRTHKYRIIIPKTVSVLRPLTKIIDPPTNEACFKCLFNFLSGLSNKTKKLEIESIFRYKIKLKKINDRIKKKIFIIT